MLYADGVLEVSNVDVLQLQTVKEDTIYYLFLSNNRNTVLQFQVVWDLLFIILKHEIPAH